MTIKIIKIIASIIISVCGVMASFVIGQNFAGIDLRKADVLTKVKLLIELLGSWLIIYAAYLFYASEKYSSATWICIIVTIVMAICSRK